MLENTITILVSPRCLKIETAVVSPRRCNYQVMNLLYCLFYYQSYTASDWIVHSEVYNSLLMQ